MTKAYPYLSSLASRHQRDIIFIFLNTSSAMLSRPNFGVTEASAVRISCKGEPLNWSTRYVDPEAPIDRMAALLTGITDEQVSNQPNWGNIGQFIVDAQASGVAFAGFNIKQLTLKIIASQNERYGIAAPSDDGILDLLDLSSAVNGKINDSFRSHLELNGVMYKEQDQSAEHRVKMELHMAEQIMSDHGLDQVSSIFAGKGKSTLRSPLRHLVKSDVIANYLEANPYNESSVSDLNHRYSWLFPTEDAVRKGIKAAIIDGEVTPDEVSIYSLQADIRTVLDEAIEKAWRFDEATPMAPLVEIISADLGKPVCSVQIMIAMAQAGYGLSAPYTLPWHRPSDEIEVPKRDKPTPLRF